MATKLMTPEKRPAEKPSQRQPIEATVSDIIQAARSNLPRAKSLGAWVLSGTSALLLWASFTPVDWGALGWVAIVPLILLVRLARPTNKMYLAIYVAAFCQTLFSLQWMRLGDPTMYVAWIALTFYVAMYLPLFVGLSRVAVHRLKLPLALAVPLVWVGLEYARAHFLTGFSWYYLAHTQYQWIEIIQISDLVGAYGVSFLIAMTSACLAGLVPVSFFVKLRLLAADQQANDEKSIATGTTQLKTAVVCLTIFSAVLGYGFLRRSQAEFKEGPRVALVQGNFDSEAKHNPEAWREIYSKHNALTGKAVQYQPDMIVWPETMFRWPVYERETGMSDVDLLALAPNVEGLRQEAWLGAFNDTTTREVLADMSNQAGATLVLGLETIRASSEGLESFNSAALIKPGEGQVNRYDKRHLVPFGEYIPFKESMPWLIGLTPFPPDFGLTSGASAAVFEDDGYRFAPVICFEDTVPHLVRDLVATANGAQSEKPIDCILNLTNDGWFHGSSELDQHLITATFRAVECRTPIVRAVNTGVSAFIDGDGVVIEPDVYFDADARESSTMRDAATGKWIKQRNAVLVDSVPLDSRSSFYVKTGDWFSQFCLAATAIFLLVGLRKRKQSNNPGYNEFIRSTADSADMT